MKFSVLFIASILIAAVLIAGCSQPAAQQPSTTQGVIKVGVIASLTGPASNVGTNMWQSAQVAADEINANGGVTLKDGSKGQIKLIVGDDE
jgi:branched-chain amino acid transport system substrate-binding protein